MRKFLAVIKREYIQRVRTKFFVVATVLGPAMMLVFSVVPSYLAGLKAGGPVRVAVVDESGKLYELFRDALMTKRGDDENESQQNPASQVNSNQQERMKQTARFSEQGFALEQIEPNGQALEDIKRRLRERVLKGEIDAYIVIPRDILANSKAEFYGRNTGDVFTRETVASRLTSAVRDLRLAEEHVPQNVVKELNRRVTLSSTKVSARGEEKDSGGGFVVVFAFGFIIYVTTLLYGQMILAAVIEEKETRIAEILFSSMRAFPLMMGKLVGVSLVALTQLGIWGLAFLLFALYGVGMLAAQGLKINLPHNPAMMFFCFVLYFLLGYYLYSAVYALVGSVVTTTQEGGQLALPIVLMLVGAICLAVPVIRSPNSSLAFWASMFPFFAPITMLVRIITETPPLWQIALSLAIGFATVVGLIWLASRIYRVGMLMTGKRASIPEIWRWVRQA